MNRKLTNTLCQAFLWIVPLPFLESAYSPGHLAVYFLAVALQAGLVGVAAFAITKMRNVSERQQHLDRASALLILGWLLVAIALNMGAPPRGADWLHTIPDQHVRYAALVSGALVFFGGFAVIASNFRGEPQLRLSQVALAVSAFSTLLFVAIFLPYAWLLTNRYEHEIATRVPPAWWHSFSTFIASGVMAQRLGSSVAAILFLAALHRARRFGIVSTSAIAALAVLIAIGGFFVHIPPAVVFVPSYLIGVTLIFGERQVNSLGSELSA